MARHGVYLWLEHSTHDGLRAVAQERGMKISEVAEGYIRDGLSGRAEERLEGPALPAVRQTVEAALAPHVERLAALIVKTHLEAGIGERLTFVLVAQTLGPDRARQFLDAARTKSIEALKRPLSEQRPVE